MVRVKEKICVVYKKYIVNQNGNKFLEDCGMG